MLYCIIIKPTLNIFFKTFHVTKKTPNLVAKFWPVTLKFDWWPWKTIGHLFYVASSFVYHFIAISGFKLKLVRKCSIRVKIGDLLSRVTLKFDRWPWKTIARAPLLCYFKLCASFRSHWWIQTGVTVQKHPIWSKSMIFLAVWPWNFMDDLEKQQGTSHKQHQAICIIPSSYMNSNFSYSPETAKLGYDLCDLDLWPMTLTFYMIITSVIGTVITPENCVMIGWWEHSQKGVTDRHIWTDGRTEPFIELLGRS